MALQFEIYTVFEIPCDFAYIIVLEFSFQTQNYRFESHHYRHDTAESALFVAVVY
jgi:hypothetical protein